MVSLGSDLLTQVLRGHILHFLDGQLGVFGGYPKMPHRPDGVPKVWIHEDLYPLPQSCLFTLLDLTHAGTELTGTQRGILHAETQDVGLHSAHVHRKQRRLTVQ